MITLGFIISTIVLGVTAWRFYDDKKLACHMYQESERIRKESENKYYAATMDIKMKGNEINALRRDLKESEEITERYRKDYCEESRRVRDLKKQIENERGKRASLMAIKFTANVPNSGWTRTEFKQGKGACGLTVDGLAWEELSDRYVLTQWHTDGTHKKFEYMKVDIVGRIEKHYK